MPSTPQAKPSRIEKFSERYLTHVKGKLGGQPLVFADWQRRILREIFCVTDDAGLRLVRNYYVSVPRKAGKSTLAAAVALYFLLCDPEAGGEIYSAAKAAKQARIVFDTAKRMVEANPTLRSRVTIHRDALSYKDRTYKPLSTEARSAHGLNPSCLIVDELHCFDTQLDREYFEALTSAQGAREQPLTLMLTTAGYDSNSLCGEMDRYAQKVSSRVIEDPTFGSFISRADPEDDWRDPAVWRKANPNLGVSVYESYYEEKAARAESSPALVLEFQRFQLNQWVENVAQFIIPSDWDACAQTYTEAELEGRDCYGGLDLSSTTDLSAFVLTFPPRAEGEPVKTLSYCWLPADNMRERVRRDMVPYDAWAKDGFLELTPGNVVDLSFIIHRILDLDKRFNIREINFDPHRSSEVVNALQNAGIQVVQFRQGMLSFSGPTKQLLALVKQKRLAHDGHPVLRWCISNLQVETDAAENVKPNKQIARERIDLAVALIMSLDSAVADEPPEPQTWGFREMYAAIDEPEEQAAIGA